MVISFLAGPKYFIKHADIKDCEKISMQNEKNSGTRIHDRGDFSQPGRPSTEGPVDFHNIFKSFMGRGHFYRNTMKLL